MATDEEVEYFRSLVIYEPSVDFNTAASHRDNLDPMNEKLLAMTESQAKYMLMCILTTSVDVGLMQMIMNAVSLIGKTDMSRDSQLVLASMFCPAMIPTIKQRYAERNNAN